MPLTPLTFPAESDPSYSEIKQWMVFYAANYSTFSSNRVPDVIVGTARYAIALPYPGVYNTQNQQEYSNMPTPQIKAFDIGMFGSLQQSLLGTIEKTESFLRGGNVMTFDHMETVLQPGGRRTHRFEFNLIAKTPESAANASNIALGFQTLMHPGANTQSIYTQTHPPLWQICGSNTSAGAVFTTDNGLLDGFALPSVLASVDVNRAPIQNVPYIKGFNPLAINLKLNFVELEPAFAGPDGLSLKSRSQRG